jgi:hypothetical protein
MAGTEKDFKVKKGLIVSEGITLGGHTFNDIDIGSEHVDTDDHIMSSGAIREKIESYNYSTTAGTVTSVTAGTGMTQSGTNTVNPTLNVIGGDGITANADNVAITAAQTTITSVLNTGLVIGRDSTDQIKFSTDNQIIFRVGNTDGVTFKVSGEIEATKFDGNLEGNADTASAVGVTPNDAAGSFIDENNLIMFLPDGDSSSGTGNYRPESSTDFHYNPSSTVLTVPKITSDLTGNASGNAGTVTSIGNLTGDVTSSNRATTIANNAVTLAKMAGLARGKIIYGDSNGNPAALTIGSNGQVLTSDGTDISWGSAGGGASAIGELSDAITTSISNIGLGSGALDSLTASGGNHNVALGINAGTAITTGDRNISIGYGAGDGYDTESDNIAIGYDALGGTVAGGERNVVIGNYAGDAVTSAYNSVFVGNQAGSANQTGNTNTTVGYRSMYNGTGQQNVMIGGESGYGSSGSSTGNYNVMVGKDAGYAYTTASNLTLVGKGAGGSITSGSNNVALGRNSLYAVVDGVNNIGIGFLAGDNITSGDYNVVIGAADVPSATGNSQLSISSGNGGVTWIQGNSDGIVLGALTPLFFERGALNTTTVDMRVPTVQSSTANPNAYPMPFAGKVMAVSFLFAGGSITSNSNANTWRLRTNGAASGTDFSWSSDSLTLTNTNNYTKVVTGSDVAMTFNAGDILQLQRTASGTSLNNAQAIVWVKYNL